MEKAVVRHFRVNLLTNPSFIIKLVFCSDFYQQLTFSFDTVGRIFNKFAL